MSATVRVNPRVHALTGARLAHETGRSRGRIHSHTFVMQKIPRFGPNRALAELLRRDGQLDAILEGRGLLFERVIGPEPPPAAPPFEIPRPDWEAERLERERRRLEAAAS